MKNYSEKKGDWSEETESDSCAGCMNAADLLTEKRTVVPTSIGSAMEATEEDERRANVADQNLPSRLNSKSANNTASNQSGQSRREKTRRR